MIGIDSSSGTESPFSRAIETNLLRALATLREFTSTPLDLPRVGCGLVRVGFSLQFFLLRTLRH